MMEFGEKDDLRDFLMIWVHRCQQVFLTNMNQKHNTHTKAIDFKMSIAKASLFSPMAMTSNVCSPWEALAHVS